MRPGWDDYFLKGAQWAALRGDCTRSKVGAILVDNKSKRVLSTGYNGVKPGEEGCLAGACQRGMLTLEQLPPYSSYVNCIAKHAEHNCIEWWFRWGGNDELYHPLSGTTMYVTRQPCSDCEQLLRGYGVGRTVWPEGYLDLTPNKGL